MYTNSRNHVKGGSHPAIRKARCSKIQKNAERTDEDEHGPGRKPYKALLSNRSRTTNDSLKQIRPSVERPCKNEANGTEM